MRQCFCIGPQPGDDLCPCRKRARRDRDQVLIERGIEIGIALVQRNRPLRERIVVHND